MQQLSTRYQLEENLNTTKLMLPISGANCSIYTFSLIVTMVWSKNLPTSFEMTMSSAQSIINMSPWIELMTLSTPLFVITFFCICIKFTLPIRITMLRLLRLGDCGRSRRVAEAAAAEAADARNIYFNHLRRQWNNTAFHNTVHH